MTIWFIRQILALLTDLRQPVRADAARVLAAVLGRGASQLASDTGEPVSLAPAVAAAVELAGGRVLTQSEDMRSETRVLALAEMLEAGLRPLAVGLRALEGVEEEALEPLSSALRDRSPGVRRTLVDVLTTMGGERAVDMLVPLLQDPSPDLRSQAASALGDLEAKGAVGELERLLHDPVGTVRAAASKALQRIEASGACSSLLGALAGEARREDRSEVALAAIIEAVVALSEGALPALARALSDLPRPVARELATSLERNGAVERWLAKGDWREREELLASLLSSIADLGVARPLLDALDSTEERIRCHSVAALGHSRDPATSRAVAGLLNDPDEEVRTEAVKALTRQAVPWVLGPLARAATDPTSQVRRQAVGGIGAVLSARARWETERLPADFDLDGALADCQRVLLTAVRESSAELRAEAARALAAYSTAEAADALAAMALADPEDETREAAATAFAACGFAHKRRLLVSALEDPDDARRARGLIVLSRLDEPDVARHIIQALDDPSDLVRKAALQAIASAELGAVTEALLPLLRSADPRVRAAVATQLGRAQPADVIEALVGSLSDPEEEVRVSVLEAIGAMGRAARRHQGAIAARRGDPSPRVREAAAAALDQLRDAWSEMRDTADGIRRGPLSAADALTLIEMAAGGELAPLLRALASKGSTRAVLECLTDEARERLPRLLRALQEAPDQDHIQAALSIAGAIREGADAAAFFAALRALDSDVRLMAVEIVGRLGTPAAADALVDVLQRDPLADVRSRAASLLADSPSSSARAALQRAHRDDPNSIVRRVAGRALDREIASGPERPVLMETDEGASEADSASY